MAVFAWFVLLQMVMGGGLNLASGNPLNRSDIISAAVEELNGVADFRSVRLAWKCNSSRPSGFTVKYCEVVTWGKDKCGTQLVNATEAQLDANSVELSSPHPIRYEAIVGGLRLATNYSFEVQPVVDAGSTQALRGRSLQHNDIVFTTRGFSASPRSCLGDRSEIDVETGPFFSGRISIEGATDKRCTWIGDPRDPSFIHTFTINHEVCGGNKKADRMENIIIVTESRSIITHTARRFMVVCYLLPETYTIKASLQIPGGDSPAPKAEEDKEDVHENFLDFGLKSEDKQRLTQYPGSKMISARQTAELEQVAHLFEDNQKETTTAHLVLMVILVVAAAIGVTTTVWWFIGGARSKKNSIPDSSVPSRIEDDNSDDRKLVFVSSNDDDGEISDPYGFNADSFGKSECATTFVLAPSMNMAFRTLGDSNC